MNAHFPWQHVVRKSLILQVEQCLTRGQQVAVTGSRGSGRTSFIQSVSRKLKHVKLLEIENPLQAIQLRDRHPEMSFLHVDELPEDAVRSLLKDSVSTEIQMRCILETVGGHPGNLRVVHDALMALVPQHLADQASLEFEFRSGKRAAPSAETKMLQVDSLAIERDKVVAELGGSESPLKAESERFLQRMLAVEREVLSEADDGSRQMVDQLLLIESIRYIHKQLKSPGFLLVTSGNFSELSHPVIVSLLRNEILCPIFTPLPRLVCESTLTRKYLQAWLHTKDANLSLAARVKYNVLLMQHRHQVVNKLCSL